MLLAPHIVVSLFSGQTGLLISGLYILTLHFHKHLPVFAGLCFAIAGALKPHLALIFIVLFLGLKQWRLLASTAIFGLICLIITIAIFPQNIWLQYIEHMQIASKVLSSADFDHSRLSILALQLIKAPYASLMIVHRIITAAILVYIFRYARKNGASFHLYCLVVVGAFIVSPYGYVYDTPLLILPLLYWWDKSYTIQLTSLERLSFILISILPVMTHSIQTVKFPIAPITLILALCTLIFTRNSTYKI